MRCSSTAFAQGDFRASSARFPGENLDQNLAHIDAVKTIADAKVAPCFLVATTSVPLVGARWPDRLAERRAHGDALD
jgi:aryl-alcohol dehydrogenase-like predicted oxidoreductase